LDRVVGRMKLVPTDSASVQAARGVGISFGNEIRSDAGTSVDQEAREGLDSIVR
jgi:hypothetical protein